MRTVPLLPAVGRMGVRPLAFGGPPPGQRDPSGFEGVSAVEIVVPDGYSAALLVEYAARSFAAEVIFDSGWVVRFEPPSHGGDWVVELLSLVEEWLKAVPLPCAKVRQGKRSHLIRVPIDKIAPLYPMGQRLSHGEGGGGDAA